MRSIVTEGTSAACVISALRVDCRAGRVSARSDEVPFVSVVRRRELIAFRFIRVPITGAAVDDLSEKRNDVGHEPAERAQHGRQQRLAG